MSMRQRAGVDDDCVAYAQIDSPVGGTGRTGKSPGCVNLLSAEFVAVGKLSTQ